MPNASVGHATPSRADLFTWVREGRLFEEYSEFLICIEDPRIRPSRFGSVTVCLWHRNAALKRTTLGEEKEFESSLF